MKRTRKQMGKLLLSVCMVCTMLPLVAFSKEGGPDSCKPRCAREITAEFSDANFLAEVRAALGKNKRAPIFDSDNFASVTTLLISGKNITSLAGIQYFTELCMLSCNGNQLSALDVSNNTKLTELYCSGNQLNALDTSKNIVLRKLSCNGNQLSALDVSNNTKLTELNCSDNYMADESLIKGLNKNLTTIFIFYPQYSSTPAPIIVNNTTQSSNQTVDSYVPTTPEEILRYSYKGKETVEFFYVTNPSKVTITINNSIQGKLFFDAIANVLGDYQIGRTYNIVVNGNKDTDVIDNPVSITLTIPEVLRKEGRTFKMIGVMKNGVPFVLEDIDVDVKTLTIITNHFYAYALVYRDK